MQQLPEQAVAIIARYARSVGRDTAFYADLSEYADGEDVSDWAAVDMRWAAFTGIYAVTKGALDKYAYSLRMELQLLGISVVVLRPGAVDTGLLDDSTRALGRFCENTELYPVNAGKFRSIVEKVEARKIPPETPNTAGVSAAASPSWSTTSRPASPPRKQERLWRKRRCRSAFPCCARSAENTNSSSSSRVCSRRG